MKRLFYALAALMLAGCGSQPGVTSPTITATRVALVADAASAIAVGQVRLPQGFALPDDMTVTLRSLQSVDAVASSAKLGADGGFYFEHVPTGVPLLVEVRTRYESRLAPLSMLLKAVSGVNCCTVDVASTAVWAKIGSDDPWVQAPSDVWAPVIETMDPGKLTHVQDQVRDDLGKGVVSPGDQAQAIGDGRAEHIADQVLAANPGLGNSYDQALQGTEANLTVHIASIGDNTAPIPHKDTHVVLGVLQLDVASPPIAYQRVEFFLNDQKVGVASAATGWQAKLDTWRFPNGGYTLTSVGVSTSGSRSVPDRSYVNIQNEAEGYCATP